jgi:hypothetical protein
MIWILESLPENLKNILLKSYHLADKNRYRAKVLANKSMTGSGGGLFATVAPVPLAAKTGTKQVIWATDNYVDKGSKYGFVKPVHDLSVIVPRVEKSKADQQKRTKQKAEVFTPSWVCNLQNNLIDDEVLYPGAFNTVSENDQKLWNPSERVEFKDEAYTWVHYVIERRLEACAGEGPYLMSPYDTTTGVVIPVRDENGLFQRIGILDRKLRIVTENANEEIWLQAALYALKATYGYEWQGDNLLLARLNFINTFSDYYLDFFKTSPSLETLEEVAEIAAWNLWQMDGLKMVSPLTCSETCAACLTKKNAGHDGDVSLIRFGREIAFEELLPKEKFVAASKKKR